MYSIVIHSLQKPNSHIIHAAKLQWPSLFKSGRLGIPPWSHSVIREFTKLPGIINTLSYWRVVSTHAVSHEGAQHNLCNVGFMPSEIRTRSNQLTDIDSFQRRFLPVLRDTSTMIFSVFLIPKRTINFNLQEFDTYLILLPIKQPYIWIEQDLWCYMYSMCFLKRDTSPAYARYYQVLERLKIITTVPKYERSCHTWTGALFAGKISLPAMSSNLSLILTTNTSMTFTMCSIIIHSVVLPNIVSNWPKIAGTSDTNLKHT